MASKYYIPKKRRGVSQLLAVIITIAIVIAMGVGLFVWTGHLFTSSSSVQEITVTDASLIVDSSGSGALSVTVRNTGTVSISGLSVANITPINSTGVSLDFGVSSPSNLLAPGRSASASGTITNAAVGNSYIFKVTATFVDGSSKTFTFAVVAQEM